MSKPHRLTRSSAAANGLDESFFGRSLRNRNVSLPDEQLQTKPLAPLRSRHESGSSSLSGMHDLQYLTSRKRMLSGTEKDESTSSEALTTYKRAKRLRRSEPCEVLVEVKDNVTELGATLKCVRRCLNLNLTSAIAEKGSVDREKDEKEESELNNCDEVVVRIEEEKGTELNAQNSTMCGNTNQHLDTGEKNGNTDSASKLEGGGKVLSNGCKSWSNERKSNIEIQVSEMHGPKSEMDEDTTTLKSVQAVGSQPAEVSKEVLEGEVDVVGGGSSFGLMDQDASVSPHVQRQILNSGLPFSLHQEPSCLPASVRSSPRKRKVHKVCASQIEEIDASMEDEGIDSTHCGLSFIDEKPSPKPSDGPENVDNKLKSLINEQKLEGDVTEDEQDDEDEEEEEEIEEEEEEEPDVYYFESDHLALKHNKDYQRLLQAMVVLEAQRSQAVRDLDRLSQHQQQALANPIAFVEKLQNKEPLGLPVPQRVVCLPTINWEQYTSGLACLQQLETGPKPCTRRLKLSFDRGYPVRPESPQELRTVKETGSELHSDKETESAPELPGSDGPCTSTSGRVQIVRGRLAEGNKPETFNQLWTIEEQKRLEELLLKFPPEEVEARRWHKIASALGNRTPKQVASRVQKYFIKLAKAGLPIPGRTPNPYLYSRKAPSKRQHPLNRLLFRPSTFMSSHLPPVFMDEEDSQSSLLGNHFDDLTNENDISDEDDIPCSLHITHEYQELMHLKRLRRHLQLIQAGSALVQHVGYKCDNCGSDPIQGVRWHCQDCPEDLPVDLCDSCSDCLFETQSHGANHCLEPISCADSTFLDQDYCMSHARSYNYLDPNYFPANR
uniref:ZZ-type zinc finger-containing protein 3 isoform X2 n=1 Tax=Myxine glutinosa TaxID=7769 RepID=UPI00358DE62D